MLDEKLRFLKDIILNPIARLLLSVPPWVFTLAGLLAGIAAAIALWQQQYGLGLVLWIINRLFDGLDGAVARQSGTQSDFGGYLDTLCDYVIYAGLPIGIGLGAWAAAPSPTAAHAIMLSLLFLLSTFYINSASWMFLSALMEKRMMTESHRPTTVHMTTGLIGGTETIIFFCAFILFPGLVTWLFSLMGFLVCVTIVQRLVWASKHI